MEQPTAAEQRAFAVAKLKRAASLPRMKDGRRPPMHVEAVSEGEKSQLERNGDDAEGQQEDESQQEEDSFAVSDGQEGPDAEWVGESSVAVVERNEAKAEEVKPEEEPPISPSATPLPSEDAATKSSRRRSRSRSRGRTSKDFKGKARATQSPLPTSAVLSANDSSPDEGPPQSSDTTPAPLLVSPIPSHFALLQAQRMFATPEPGMMYPGTSPPTPALPTLQDLQREAIQRGLFRSNSAAARMMAMQFNGGADAYDTSFGSPSGTPPPLPGKIFRNNTVTGSGGERSAASKIMMRRLRERVKESEAEQTSGGEEPVTPPPRQRKRRSRRGSTNRSTVVDDREPASATTPNTPIATSSTLPSSPEKIPDPPPPHSAARSPTPNARRNSIERSRETTLAKLTGESPTTTYNYETPLERRGVVVEEEDDVPDRVSPLRPTYNGLPTTPPRVAALRLPHASDAPSSTSTDSGGVGVPVYLSETIHRHHDMFPMSPFATPLREKSGGDDEEEEIMHQHDEAARRSPWNDAFNREISWVADPVPESRIPVHDDDEYDDASDTDEQEDQRSVPIGQRSDDPDEDDEVSSPRASSGSKDLVVDLETSPEPTFSNIPPSPSSVMALQRQRSDDSASLRIFPARLSVASPIQPELSSPHPEFAEWEESVRVNVSDTTPKKPGDSGFSKWDKVKNTFMRTGSSSGRRSRTNSLRERTNNTDSSASRESGASITSSSKTDKEPQSASYFPSSPGAVSPVPPASTETMLKYTDAKLFPFPGMIRLEEERNRARGLSLNASSPDIVSPNTDELSALSSGSSRTPQPSPEAMRDRKLSHQASDTRLLAKFSALNSAPSLSSAPSSGSHPDYLSVSSSNANGTGWLNGKLPTNREGVKKWLSAKKLFSSQSSQPSYPSLQKSPPIIDHSSSTDVGKKPSLSDLLKGRKENDLMADWDDLSKTPTSTSGSTLLGRTSTKEGRESVTRDAPLPEEPVVHEAAQEPTFLAAGANVSPNGDVQYASYAVQLQQHEPLPSPPDALSATPDPMSSLDEFPTRSSTSTLSSEHSPEPVIIQSQGSIVLERLDELLSRGSRGPSGGSLIEDAPRKLLLSSPVLQVANSNTVKDRFLFLFNDILVIAKPITQDNDSLLDTTKPSPLDRKFIVKSVVQLRHLRFTAERDDLPAKANAAANRHPLIRTFVVQFSKDPDRAIASFFDKTQSRDDPVVLGQLLFKTLDLDRAKLGDYLSRRTSKVVLKAYFEGFGFGGLRVDKALRVFLQSLHVPSPSKSSHSTPLDYVLDAFASRWYEANAGIVAYDKDLAVRLVRALVQLNEVLHGGIVHDPWNHPRLKRNVTSRDFIDAFRRYDARCLVSDDLLDKIYTSIKREPISQARNAASSGTPDLPITLKRPVPARLTYRMQSEPVVLRIPQADPSLTIHLHGQDLIFDPPYLTFVRSAEASFRITGTSLGPKTITFSRSGSTSLLYTGLPLSNPLIVERSFMRNTFQLAFMNHDGEKRQYMFSVDDPVIRHNWTVSLKRQIDIATTNEAQRAGPSRFKRAAEQTAFRVLQETLIPTPGDETVEWENGRRVRTPASPSPLPESRHVSLHSSARGPPASPRRNSRLDGVSPSPHVRSKSRSQVYHRHGPGKLEHQQLDLLLSSPKANSAEFPPTADDDEALPIENWTRLWSGKDLEIVCQQNSAIVVALASLQIGLDNIPPRLQSLQAVSVS
ncbi:hypothetical protein BV25DRAFT_395576 [Artomyces pyxidatus]|uniref:Uncharacterized protein n=1 Tax=Artomyces pyxidatus TaxID=48021 RepID=A0ACB8T416_9AGAM|nr:hypothetical protein BV25DRAFT_395576 [Artomyces pyxidatus]